MRKRIESLDEFINEQQILNEKDIFDIKEFTPEINKDLYLKNSDNLKNSIVVNIDNKWYRYGQDIGEIPKWEDLEYLIGTDDIVMTQDVLKDSDKSSLAKRIKNYLKSSGIKVNKVYLGDL